MWLPPAAPQQLKLILKPCPSNLSPAHLPASKWTRSSAWWPRRATVWRVGDRVRAHGRPAWTSTATTSTRTARRSGGTTSRGTDTTATIGTTTRSARRRRRVTWAATRSDETVRAASKRRRAAGAGRDRAIVSPAIRTVTTSTAPRTRRTSIASRATRRGKRSAEATATGPCHATGGGEQPRWPTEHRVPGFFGRLSSFLFFFIFPFRIKSDTFAAVIASNEVITWSNFLLIFCLINFLWYLWAWIDLRLEQIITLAALSKKLVTLPPWLWIRRQLLFCPSRRGCVFELYRGYQCSGLLTVGKLPWL